MKNIDEIIHLNLGNKGGAWIAANRINTMLIENGLNSRIVSLRKNPKIIKRDLPGWIDFKIERLSPVEYTTSFFRSMAINENSIDKAIQDATIINLHWLPGHIRRSVWDRIKRKKIVWTLHDMQPFTAFCHHSNFCELYIKDCSRCPQALTWERPLIASEFMYRKDILEQADIEIISPSEWLAEKVSKSLIFQGKKVHTIPNPIDAKLIHPSKNVGKNEILRIGILGSNYGAYKGSNRTLSFIKSIPNDIKSRIELRILGDVHGDMENFRRSSIEIGSSITEVLSFMDEIDLFLYLSDFENLPNLLIELQAKGIPVAAMPVGGVSETFLNGQSGWEIHTPEDFIEILKMVQLNPAVLEKFSRNAYLNAREKFSFERILPEYLRVYG